MDKREKHNIWKHNIWIEDQGLEVVLVKVDKWGLRKMQ